MDLHRRRATNPKFNLLQKINNDKSAWPGVWDSMGTWLPGLCVDEWSDEPTVWMMTLDCELVVLTDKGDHFELKENLQDKWRKEWKAKGWDAINPTPTLGNIAADPKRPYIYMGDCEGRGTFDYLVFGEKLGWTPRINVESGETKYVPAVSAMSDSTGWRIVRTGKTFGVSIRRRTNSTISKTREYPAAAFCADRPGCFALDAGGV